MFRDMFINEASLKYWSKILKNSSNVKRTSETLNKKPNVDISWYNPSKPVVNGKKTELLILLEQFILYLNLNLLLDLQMMESVLN